MVKKNEIVNAMINNSIPTNQKDVELYVGEYLSKYDLSKKELSSIIADVVNEYLMLSEVR